MLAILKAKNKLKIAISKSGILQINLSNALLKKVFSTAFKVQTGRQNLAD